MVCSYQSVTVLTFSILLCLAIIPTVRGCLQMPPGQGRAVNFTVSGFTLPSAMAFSTVAAVTSQVPQISRSAEAATALVRNLVMEAVTDVLEERGRSEGLPSFVVSGILGQLTIQVNYTPLSCGTVYLAPGNQAQGVAMACFTVNDRVTALCMMMPCAVSPPNNVLPVPDANTRISGSVMTTNLIMANWTTQMWQSVLSRALQLIGRGSFGAHFAAASVTVM